MLKLKSFALYIALSLMVYLALSLLAALPAKAFEVVDGQMAITLPAEQKVMNACITGEAQCFIMSQDMLQKYGEYVAGKVDEAVRADLNARYDTQLESTANQMAEQLCKNKI